METPKTINDLKRMLNEYLDISLKINEIHRKIKDERFKKENIEDALQAAVNDGMPHGTGTSDPVLGRVIRAVDIYRENIVDLVSSIEELELKRRTIGEALRPLMNKLNSNESKVINFRYSTGLNWREIDKQFYYAEDTCKRIHWTALKKMIFL
jgi:DNA-directed RNA polymerase specialized sigma subunit